LGTQNIGSDPPFCPIAPRSARRTFLGFSLLLTENLGLDVPICLVAPRFARRPSLAFICWVHRTLAPLHQFALLRLASLGALFFIFGILGRLRDLLSTNLTIFGIELTKRLLQILLHVMD
jgi:hypothetical protein